MLVVRLALRNALVLRADKLVRLRERSKRVDVSTRKDDKADRQPCDPPIHLDLLGFRRLQAAHKLFSRCKCRGGAGVLSFSLQYSA